MKKYRLILGAVSAMLIAGPSFCYADTTPAGVAPYEKTEFEQVTTGHVQEADIDATLNYLFPKEVASVNDKVLTHYEQNPNAPYTSFLNFDDQQLYYQIGEYILPLQAEVTLHEFFLYGSTNGLVTPKGFSNLKADKTGVYGSIYAQAIQADDLWQKL